MDAVDLRCCGNCKHRKESEAFFDDYNYESYEQHCANPVNARDITKPNSVCEHWEYDGLSNINRREL